MPKVVRRLLNRSWRLSWLLGVALMMTASACSSDEAEPVLVNLDGIADVQSSLPDELVGVDLGALGPEGPLGFCDAVGGAPVRWIDDALIPVQLWIDTFTEVIVVPAAASDPIARLLEFAERRQRWSLTGDGERPVWGDGQTAAALALADAAIATCEDLPLVLGLPGTSDRPVGWSDFDAAEVADRCARDRDRVVAAVGEYVAEFGRQPRHQMEMEPVLPLFYASDFHGVTLDDDGASIVLPVPQGACDFG